VTVHFTSYWPLADAETVTDLGDARGAVRYARDGDLVDAYPAGAHDRELAIDGSPSADAVRDFTASVLADDPRCRRVVFSVPEQDLPSVAFAEEAGFRYVVDVETRAGAFSLLVTEPEWVVDQAADLDDIPLSE
jgi:hypothetical protein